jgi:hypothetical protein
MWHRKVFFLCFSSAIIFFIFGMGVGHYHWPPFKPISKFKNFLSNSLFETSVEYRGEVGLLEEAFTDPVIDTDLYYPPINDLEGIRKANERIFMFREGFDSAFEKLEVTGVDQLDRSKGMLPVIRVRYRYQERQFEAFAYGNLPIASDSPKLGSLIIPGSGINQSFYIAQHDLNNYHSGFIDLLNQKGFNTYILIKPNESLLAIHNGHLKKLNGGCIWNWQLNRGGSYSVSYIVASLAIMKWMKKLGSIEF